MDSSEQLLWSVQVDHQLFALQKLDVTVSLSLLIRIKIPHTAKVQSRIFPVLFCSIFINNYNKTIQLCRVNSQK